MSDYSSSSNYSDWEENVNDELAYKSFFGEKTFGSGLECLHHDFTEHGVNLPLLMSSLDFFERIRLVNYIRKEKPEPQSLQRLDRSAAFLEDDAYLKPVIEDDGMLQIDFDDIDLARFQSGDLAFISDEAHQPAATKEAIENEIIENLRVQLADTTATLDYLKANLQGSARFDAKEIRQDTTPVQPTKRDDDSHYFESYSHNEIHEVMLKDRVRTESYRDFIQKNSALFRDAVVLDVGCGTGILSMFAAQAGAKKVYAVDASEIFHKAQQNIVENGLDHIITPIKGKVEEITIPEKVDIIISEWMGYFLLYESMLDSVLYARDQYLKPEGVMAPSQCSIIFSLADLTQFKNEYITFWDNIYGFKMTSMKENITKEALIDVIKKEEVVSDTCVLRDITTRNATVSDLDFATDFSLKASKDTPVNAFLGWFDTFFTTDNRLAKSESEMTKSATVNEVFFSTGPQVTPTHWKQTVFVLDTPLALKAGDVVTGHFDCVKNDSNSRELVVTISYTVNNQQSTTQKWFVK